MKSLIYILYLLFPCVYLTPISGKINCHDKPSYIGAVVDYSPFFSLILSPNENIMRNIKEYEKYIHEAKEQHADIIVFPEYGLTSIMITQNSVIANLYSSQIPHPSAEVNPCRESKKKNWKNSSYRWSNILTLMSCAAKRNQIYVALNLPERVLDKNNTLLYNTNIVFDRNGTIISRYRKYNLYNEAAFNTTALPEYESFTTDFGVTFGTMTCFDILYADPTLFLIENKGVTDLLFPTAWMPKMPFLTAIQTQAGLVKAYGINLLASNYNNPNKNLGGSGIYSPTGILNYTIPIINESKMLIANIPKLNINRKTFLSRKNNKMTNTRNIQKDLYLETSTERWDGFTTELLETNSVNNKMICNEDLCCYFTLSTTGESDYLYRLIVNSQFRSSGINRHHVQMCGIVACADENVQSCGKILNNVNKSKLFTNVHITGNFIMNGNYVQIPSIVNYNLSTLAFNSYSYNTVNEDLQNTISVKIEKPVHEILGISIYGRSRAIL